jgi:hypothetical protein
MRATALSSSTDTLNSTTSLSGATVTVLPLAGVEVDTPMCADAGKAAAWVSRKIAITATKRENGFTTVMVPAQG